MQFTNKYGLPEEIARALATDFYDKHDTISATSLIDSPRIYYLRKRHKDEITEDVSDRVWTLFGSAIHAALERVKLPNHLKEERLVAEVNGIKISGKFDVFGGRDELILTDYKVTSTWTIIYQSRLDEWTKQLNIYAFLLRENGFEPSKAQIIAILRDWQKSKAVKSDYPKVPIVVVPIELWPEQRIDGYIASRVELFKRCAELPDDQLPVCTPEERWQSQTTYAVMKPNRKTAYRVLDNLDAACELAVQVGGRVEIREGQPKRCLDYCHVRDFCNWFKEYQEGGQ